MYYIEDLMNNRNDRFQGNNDWLIITPSINFNQYHHLVRLGFEYIPNQLTGGDNDIFIIHIPTKKFTYTEFGDSMAQLNAVSTYENITDLLTNYYQYD